MLWILALPIFLQTDHLDNPIGIDSHHPRFTWRIRDERAGARQTAFTVTVGTDSAQLIDGAGSQVWSSGQVTTADQSVSYAGQPLRPFTKYFWKVESWDQNNNKSVSTVASFETGMQSESNWKGAWISDSRDPKIKPAPYFRKVFSAAKQIRSARAYIAAAGLYELYINGKRIGDHRLDPMYTRFDRRNLYVSYDVTGDLQQGKNAVGVLLGNGWYNHQSTAVWYFHEAPWRSRPCFIANIRITYTDGTEETIVSGKDWKTSLSPIIFNSIYTGEHIDHRLAQPGWNTAGFNDSAWKEVMFRSAPSAQIVSQAMQPVRQIEEVRPVSLKKINDTTWVYNLGRNIAGVSKIDIAAAAGATLRLKHGERLYPDGRVDISNIDVHYRPTDDKDPFQTDIYICGGSGKESFMPTFGYKGFQYIEVTAPAAVKLAKEDLVAYFMHSDVSPVGEIKSSNPTIDKIWKAANNSYCSNLFGYPTDCPQREKNGWTGDAHIASETGLYNFDGITVYEKWLADHRDEQQPDGTLPSIIPTDGWGYEWGNGPDWTSTIAIIPWNVYLFYGDKTMLIDNYDNIRRYVDRVNETAHDGLTKWGLGDWVPVKSVTPVELTSSAYFYADASILAKTAVLLGKTEDAQKYTALAEGIKTAFNRKYLDTAAALYGTGLQTELSVPLFWGLAPDGYKARIAANLAKRVLADSSHLDVGLLGTKAILNALSENGYADLAYTLASREKYPSWGWWIVNGATTLYENWPIDAKSDISMNHIMFGEIGAWLFKGLGGILPDPAQPGFRNVLLRPHFVRGLAQFSARHDGPFGTIVSEWTTDRKGIVYTATIPPNSTAVVQLPDAKGVIREEKVAAGRHQWRIGK